MSKNDTFEHWLSLHAAHLDPDTAEGAQGISVLKSCWDAAQRAKLHDDFVSATERRLDACEPDAMVRGMLDALYAASDKSKK